MLRSDCHRIIPQMIASLYVHHVLAQCLWSPFHREHVQLVVPVILIAEQVALCLEEPNIKGGKISVQDVEEVIIKLLGTSPWAQYRYLCMLIMWDVSTVIVI